MLVTVAVVFISVVSGVTGRRGLRYCRGPGARSAVVVAIRCMCHYMWS